MLCPARCHSSPGSALLALAIVLLPAPGLAARATPPEATVFIRLIGHVRVLRGADERVWREQLLNLREVEVSAGSGFIVSPLGLVVTNHHVIAGEKFVISVRGQKLDVSIDIAAIEVVLPAESASQPGRRYTASVAAVDPELDIAFLLIGGTELPYVALGDSDAVVSGDPVNAVGYPFGGQLEIEKTQAPDAIPAPSVSSGGVSAVRTDGAGERRYLQVSAALNPGNSGGPIVDAEGYVIGVAQSRLADASGIGFGVPINRVKRLLQMHGLDSRLPIELLSPGAVIANPAKGTSVPVPVGFDDRSPLRLRIEAATGSTGSPGSGATEVLPAEALVLRIDRVAAAGSVDQLERALLTDGMFERFHAAAPAQRPASRTDKGRKMLTGHASGTSPTTGDPLKLVYAIVDLGKEKIVARYVGPADSVAANRSLLQASLMDLDIGPLLTAELIRPVQANWVSSAQSTAGRLDIPLVEGWVAEPGLPWQCAAGLPQPSAGLVMSPAGDFTVALRAAWHGVAMKDATSAARRCSPQAGSFGETSYIAQATAWGIAYQIEGVFIHVPGSGAWQLEVIAPVQKSRFVADVFNAWTKAMRQ